MVKNRMRVIGLNGFIIVLLFTSLARVAIAVFAWMGVAIR